MPRKIKSEKVASGSRRGFSGGGLPLAITERITLGGERLTFILGPCVIEGRQFTRRIARKIHTICRDEGAEFIFKASYDKANRTSISSFRGIGFRDGCELLREIGQELGVPVTSDVHSPEEAAMASEFLDIIQIPAFLCRQTDLILAAARTGKVVNVKKGQFLAPWDVRNIADKLVAGGCRRFFFTERGTTFGYHNLVADLRSIPWIQEMGFLVVFDATHSVQRPAAQGDRTGGDGSLAPILARAAVAAGCDGLFMETHENPAKALSDGPNQIPLKALPALIRQVQKIREILR